jgi:hypothetical protein
MPADRWNCLFLFCPTGSLDDDQHGILRRIRALRGRLLIVAALPDGSMPPPALDIADALVSKELRGFDFSAYRLALDLVARHSPGADAYLQNDSVLGPLVDLDPLVDDAPWDLTGFMASAAIENHISSFAFIVRAVTPERVAMLAPAMPPHQSYDRFTDVVLMQETRLARCAAGGMSVGSYWFAADAPVVPGLPERLLRRITRGTNPPALDLRGDPMLGMPLDLARQGFPFIKRSLFGKFAGSPSTAAIVKMLADHGWKAPHGNDSSVRRFAAVPQKASGS